MTFDEGAWWGDCANTFHEEQKQLTYAVHMGLVPDWNCGHPPQFDLSGRSVVDVGGGPVSLLLKCANRGPDCLVVDPTEFPTWVADRYFAAGIDRLRIPGEDMEDSRGYKRAWSIFAEAWCYNVLQHVSDPAKIAANMLNAAPVVRVFEWVDIPAYDGHPQELRADDLREWFQREGHEIVVNENGAVGRAWVTSS